MNYRFQMQRWLPRVELRPSHGHFQATEIVSPRSICVHELLRRGVQEQYDWGEPTPVDLFIFADGEPEQRYATKICGLPYRPAASPWPTGSRGQPLDFLAQFNFADSQDLTGELPGDLLLIFSEDTDSMITPVYFEWQRLGLTSLIALDQIPTPRHTFKPCYGYLHRAVSFPKAGKRSGGNATYNGLEIYSDFLLPQYQATQIGTAPFFVQDREFSSARLLCTLSTVGAFSGPFPWVNRDEPYAEEECNYGDYLTIHDTGCIYFCLDNENNIQWGAASY